MLSNRDQLSYVKKEKSVGLEMRQKVDKYLYSFFSSGSVMRGDEETFVCFTRGGAGASVRCQARVLIVSPGASVNTVHRTQKLEPPLAVPG